MILPNGGISELIYSESVARRVISMDKTGHPFTTEVDKGISRSIRFECNNDVAVNAGGETLPPLYMIDSLAQHSFNYQVQSRWCETLPKI